MPTMADTAVILKTMKAIDLPFGAEASPRLVSPGGSSRETIAVAVPQDPRRHNGDKAVGWQRRIGGAMPAVTGDLLLADGRRIAYDRHMHEPRGL
ncbi:MAG: hypothetical protein ACE5JZ_02735 [Kiloniellales bacterium]